MVPPFPFGVIWPEAANFDAAYGVASAVALVGTLAFAIFLKRTANEHYRLLRKARRKKRRVSRL